MVRPSRERLSHLARELVDALARSRAVRPAQGSRSRPPGRGAGARRRAAPRRRREENARRRIAADAQARRSRSTREWEELFRKFDGGGVSARGTGFVAVRFTRGLGRPRLVFGARARARLVRAASSSSSAIIRRSRCAFVRSKMPPAWPAGIQLLPAHFGQRPRKAMFFPQSGQMITSECESSNFCSPSASRLFRKAARFVNVSSRGIATPTGLLHATCRSRWRLQLAVGSASRLPSCDCTQIRITSNCS